MSSFPRVPEGPLYLRPNVVACEKVMKTDPNFPSCPPPPPDSESRPTSAGLFSHELTTSEPAPPEPTSSRSNSSSSVSSRSTSSRPPSVVARTGSTSEKWAEELVESALSAATTEESDPTDAGLLSFGEGEYFSDRARAAHAQVERALSEQAGKSTAREQEPDEFDNDETLVAGAELYSGEFALRAAQTGPLPASAQESSGAYTQAAEDSPTAEISREFPTRPAESGADTQSASDAEQFGCWPVRTEVLLEVMKETAAKNAEESAARRGRAQAESAGAGSRPVAERPPARKEQPATLKLGALSEGKNAATVVVGSRVTDPKGFQLTPAEVELLRGPKPVQKPARWVVAAAGALFLVGVASAWWFANDADTVEAHLGESVDARPPAETELSQAQKQTGQGETSLPSADDSSSANAGPQPGASLELREEAAVGSSAEQRQRPALAPAASREPQQIRAEPEAPQKSQRAASPKTNLGVNALADLPPAEVEEPPRAAQDRQPADDQAAVSTPARPRPSAPPKKKMESAFLPN